MGLHHEAVLQNHRSSVGRDQTVAAVYDVRTVYNITIAGNNFRGSWNEVLLAIRVWLHYRAIGVGYNVRVVKNHLLHIVRGANNKILIYTANVA